MNKKFFTNNWDNFLGKLKTTWSRLTADSNHKAIENYMNIVGPLGNLMFYFQIYKIFVSKSSGSVSLMGFSISVIALTSWLLYGIMLKNKPLIIANAFGALGAIIVVLEIIFYPAI